MSYLERKAASWFSSGKTIGFFFAVIKDEEAYRFG
jgi:hypothetical protein